jgi:hypothetical protein
MPWFNTVGLILGMVGVVLIFKWGPPQPALEEGVRLGLEEGNVLPDGRTVAQRDADIRALRSRHLIMSRSALGLIFVGFALQLVGTRQR